MATEKRLIDANDAVSFLENSLSTIKQIYPNGRISKYIKMYEEFIDFLKNRPTVDAVEVVHGRWEDIYGGKYANPRYRCSVCKEKALYKFERDSLGNYRDIQALTPICPYCSAKLDGGNNNDI